MAETVERPVWRGVSHQYGFFVVLGAVPMMVSFAANSRASLAAAIYGASLMAMFGFSALYHRSGAPPHVEVWLERLDHAAIFVFIAGSYTPFCLVLGERAPGLLGIVWSAAGLGVLRALFWVNAPRWLSVGLYLALGWAILPFVGRLWDTIGTSGVLLLFVGGVLYSVGSVVFALKRPNPYPAVFGFHEVFHAFVIAACACQLIPVISAVKRLGA